MVRTYRRPPNLSIRPRTTGLSAGGLSTNIVFENPVHASLAHDVADVGITSLPVTRAVYLVSPQFVLSQRKDSLRQLSTIYSEYKLLSLRVYWTPDLPLTTAGRAAIAVVDDGFATPVKGESPLDAVASAPNSAACRITEAMARCWVPTEPSDVDYVNMTETLAKILFATSEVFAYVPKGTKTGSQIQLGRLRCEAQMAIRSPIDKSAGTERMLTMCHDDMSIDV